MIELRCGDCLEVLLEMSDNNIDLIVTSPPYYNARAYSHWNTYDEYLVWLKQVFILIHSKLKVGRMCCVNLSVILEPRVSRRDCSKRISLPFHFVGLMESIGFTFIEDIVWVKPEGAAINRNGNFYRHRQPIAYKPNVVNEYVFVFQKTADFLIDKIVRGYDEDIKMKSLIQDGYERTNVWKINPETNSKHPAPFPEELCRNLIEYYSFYGDFVVDPFAGSGTTGLACLETGRSFLGIEIHEDYYNMALNRLHII